MKKKILFVGLLLCQFFLPAQTGLQLQYRLCTQCPNGDNQNIDYTYSDDAINYSTAQLESDYDMRVTEGTKYHQGIDFLPRAGCRGDAVLSVEAGTVAFVKGNGNLKNIVIQNGAHAFVYMHLFNSDGVPATGMRSGDFMLVPVNQEYAIINMAASPAIAYARTSGLRIIYNRYQNSTNRDTVYTTNQVVAGAMIAPIGNSGTGPVHLHVALIENPSPFQNGQEDPAFAVGREIDRSIDPWTELDHADNGFVYRLRTRKTQNFALGTCEHPPGQILDLWNQINLSYADNTKNCIEIEMGMAGVEQVPGDDSRYNNAVMDQEEVVLNIKRIGADNDFVTARGSDFDSKFVLNPVGAKQIYPVRMYDVNNTGGIYGSPTVNGISPFTYRDYLGYHPHDYYFISDFYLRMHKLDKQLPIKENKLAQYPWDAYYQEGDYQFRVNALDVDGNWYPMASPLSFPIDNFQPFIRSVGVYSGSGTIDDKQIYYRDWNSQNVAEGTLHLSAITKSSPDALTDQIITVYAVASEPLRNAKLKIAAINNNWINGAVVAGSDNKRWKFQYGFVNLTEDACYDLAFEGEDLKGITLGQGNKLLDLPKPPCGSVSSNLSFTVPYRTGNSTWSTTIAQGQDQVHKFKVKACGNRPEAGAPPVVCIIASDVTTAVTYAAPQTSTGAINLTINANTVGMSFTWKNAADVVVGQAEDLLNVPAGLYCVEIKQECCSYFDCIEVKDCNLTVTATITQPAPASANGSVSLRMNNGTAPYQIQWNTGATSNPLSGLAPGNYQVIVEDAYRCLASKGVTLLSCPVIQVSANVILKTPSACDTTDGQIKVLSNGATGGVVPYAYYWEDEQGNILPAAPANVGPGRYCLIAMDANGCTGSKCYDLHPDHFPEISTTIKPACANANGLINVAAADPNIGNYDFIWEDGSGDYNTITSERTNLAAGTYCISITSTVTGCEIVRCYDVPLQAPDLPLELATTSVNPCPDTKNGSIDLNITGGISPFFIYWNGSTLAPYNEDQSGIGAGDYTVVVTDYCGTSVVKNVVLKALEIKFLKAVPGCLNNGEMQVSAAYGTLPYAYKWSTGSENPIVSNLPTNNYCVTVTDARNCKVTDCMYLQNAEVVELSSVRPCTGVSESGSVTYKIFNPLNEMVTIFNEGIQIGMPSYQSSFEVTIGSISAGINYHVEFKLGNCLENRVVRLNSASEQWVYKMYDEPNDLCIFDIYCNGTLMKENGYQAKPMPDFPNAFNIPCKVERFCGDYSHSVGWKHMKTRKVRALEYRMMLTNALLLNPSNPDYINQLLNDLDGKYLQSCDKVKYCEATLEITSTPGLNDIVYGNGTVTQLTGGCVLLQCFPSFEEVICGSLPPNLDLSSYNIDCQARRYNAIQLMNWYDDFENRYGAQFFASTELAFKIKELQDLYTSGDPNAYKVRCVFVTFCLSDFSVLSATDIELVQCGENPDTGIVFDTIQECKLIDNDEEDPEPDMVPCPDGDGQPYPIPIDEKFPIALMFTTPDDEVKRIYNPGTGENDFIKDFGIIRSDGFSTPKGLIRSTTGKTSLLDYNYRNYFERRQKAPDYLFYEDNWDTETFVYLEKKSANQVALNYDTPLASWEHFFSSNELLTISDMVKSNGQIIITGTFKGNLNFDSFIIGSAPALTGFVAVVGFDGVLVRSQVIQNVAADTRLEIRPGDGKYFVSGTASSSWVKLDGQNQLNLNAGGLFSFQMNDQSPLQASTPGIAISGTVKFVRSVSSKDFTRTTYLFKGVGNVIYNQVTYNLPMEGLLLLTMDNAGNFKWMQKIEQIVAGNELDLTYDDVSNLYLASTFSGSFNANNQDFASNGGKDIFFARINIDGTYVAAKSYGSPDDEIVRKCFFDSGLLYFGGEFVGQTVERQLGHSKFVRLGYNANPATIKAYMGYVTTKDLETTEQRSAPTSEAKPAFEAFPNPFNNELIIRKTATSTDQYAIEILDMLGKTVVRQNEKAEVGMNEYRIHELAKLPLGVYLVKITSAHGEEWTQKVVKE